MLQYYTNVSTPNAYVMQTNRQTQAIAPKNKKKQKKETYKPKGKSTLESLNYFFGVCTLRLNPKKNKKNGTHTLLIIFFLFFLLFLFFQVLEKQ